MLYAGSMLALEWLEIVDDAFAGGHDFAMVHQWDRL